MHGIWPHHGLLPQCKGLDWRPDGDKRLTQAEDPRFETLYSKNIMPLKPSKSNNHASWALNFSTWSRLSVWFDTAWCDRGRRGEAANDIWRQHILWRSAHWKSLWQQAATRKKDENQSYSDLLSPISWIRPLQNLKETNWPNAQNAADAAKTILWAACPAGQLGCEPKARVMDSCSCSQQ